MKKFLCGLLSAALAVSLTVPMAGAAYTDVPAESTLGGEVEKAVRYGLMNGYSDTTFGYGDSMTRAQFAAVLVRMMGWETVTPATADFTDVPVSHTWYGAVETAAAHDVVDEGGAFRPGDAITRGEMSEMLVGPLASRPRRRWRQGRLPPHRPSSICPLPMSPVTRPVISPWPMPSA